MIVGRLLNKIINIFTGLFAMATLILMLLCYIDNFFGGVFPEPTMTSIVMWRNYLTLGTIFCGGIEFTLKRNVLFAGIFALIVVAVAVFMIYSDMTLASVVS